MAIVHYVKAARKDYPDHGIKKGQPYWWLQHRFGPKLYFTKAPKASQTTQSEFLSQAYEIEERIAELDADAFETVKDLKDEMDVTIQDIRSLGEEQEEKYNNVPDNFQGSPGAELLQQRAEACDEWASELESALDDIEYEGPVEAEPKEGESYEDYKKRLTPELKEAVKNAIRDAIEQIQGASNPSLE